MYTLDRHMCLLIMGQNNFTLKPSFRAFCVIRCLTTRWKQSTDHELIVEGQSFENARVDILVFTNRREALNLGLTSKHGKIIEFP